MLLVTCVRSGKRIWTLGAVLLLPLWYLVIALQHSRGGYLASAVLITLSLAAFLLKKQKLSETRPGKAALACVLALCLVLSYKSFDVCSDLFESLSSYARNRHPGRGVGFLVRVLITDLDESIIRVVRKLYFLL